MTILESPGRVLPRGLRVRTFVTVSASLAGFLAGSVVASSPVAKLGGYQAAPVLDSRVARKRCQRYLLLALVLAGSIVATSCAAPARRLPRRIVDDPITLPDNTVRVMVSPQVSLAKSGDVQGNAVGGDITYAITSRLEYAAVMSLRYAFADDAPPAEGQRARNRFSLALTGGLTTFGYSSVDGAILHPRVKIEFRKRFWQDTYGYADITALASTTTGSGRRDGGFHSEVGVVMQVTETSALKPGLHLLHSWRCVSDCVAPQISAAISLKWRVRPVYWFEYGPAITAGHRVRHKPVDDFKRPDDLMFDPTLHLAWLMTSLDIAFYW